MAGLAIIVVHFVKKRGVLRNSDNVLLVGKIRAVYDHAASGDRQREKCLTHCPYPYHRVGKRLPARSEHELVSLRSAGQKCDPDGEHDEYEEKQRHHDLVSLFDAVCAEIQRQKRSGNDYDVVRNDRHRRRRELAEPHGGVGRHERSDEGIDKRLEDVCHDNGISDGDAPRSGKRKPAENAAGLAKALAARCPCAFICPEGACARASAHGKLGRQADIAEYEHKQQIYQQKRSAAV